MDLLTGAIFPRLRKYGLDLGKQVGRVMMAICSQELTWRRKTQSLEQGNIQMGSGANAVDNFLRRDDYLGTLHG